MAPNPMTDIHLLPNDVNPSGWDVDFISKSSYSLAGVGVDWAVSGTHFTGAATFAPDFLNGPVIAILQISIDGVSTENLNDKAAWSLTFDSGGWLKNLVDLYSNVRVSTYRVYFRKYFYALADQLPKVTVSFDIATFFNPVIKGGLDFDLNLVVTPNFTKTILPVSAARLPSLPHVMVHEPSPVQDPPIARRSPRQVPSAAPDYDLLEDVDDVKHLHPWRA